MTEIPKSRRAKVVAKAGLSADNVEELAETYEKFDVIGTHKLDYLELLGVFKKLGFDKDKNKPLFKFLEKLPAKDDPNYTPGLLDFDDFLNYVAEILNNEKYVKELYELFTDKKSGTINKKSIKGIVEELKKADVIQDEDEDKFTDEKIEAMIEKYAEKGKNDLDLDAFIEAMITVPKPKGKDKAKPKKK